MKSLSSTTLYDNHFDVSRLKISHTRQIPPTPPPSIIVTIRESKFTLQESISTIQSSFVGITRRSITGAASKFKNLAFGRVHLTVAKSSSFDIKFDLTKCKKHEHHSSWEPGHHKFFLLDAKTHLCCNTLKY